MFQAPYSTTAIYETTKTILQVNFTDIYYEGGRFFLFFTVTTTVYFISVDLISVDLISVDFISVDFIQCCVLSGISGDTEQTNASAGPGDVENLNS